MMYTTRAVLGLLLLVGACGYEDDPLPDLAKPDRASTDLATSDPPITDYVPTGNCTTSDDCGGYMCSATLDECGYFEGDWCHTGADQCNSDADCGSTYNCILDRDNFATHWTCVELSCLE